MMRIQPTANFIIDQADTQLHVELQMFNIWP